MKWILLAIPLLPLIGFAINLIIATRLHHQSEPKQPNFKGWIASIAVGLAFVLSLIVFFYVQSSGRIAVQYYEWFSAGSLTATFGFLIDPLSVTMMLVVTGVGFLIHWYSIGYMAEDTDKPRFFVYMNLFVFSMLILVMADNLALMFLGWEGVGLCSYLLISFWYQKPSAASAGTKAFIVNRIGDAGFLIGLFLVLSTFGTLHYDTLFTEIRLYPNIFTIATTVTAIGMLLFIGAMGKSAQVPLYVWLPDAMEGPTPVSALIHAATMVTAGVYMVARLFPIFSFDVGPIGYIFGISAGDLVVYTGIITALFAASIALVQHDIKRIIAYSTISQLGYMFIAVGSGAFAAGIFHLMTHAFFKALLFLAAGSVIHALTHAFRVTGSDKDPQDIRNMGELSRFMPLTTTTFIIGWLAISGIPPFSGFFSKDDILASAYHHGYHWTYWGGVLGALLTSFYMSRLIFLVFFRKTTESAVQSHLHESPSVITTPLILLAILSAFAGLLNVPEFLNGHQWFSRFLSSAVGGIIVHPQHGANEWALAAFALGASITGIGLAFLMYIRKVIHPERLAADYQPVYRLWFNKYYVDELYAFIFVRPLKWFSEKGLGEILDSSWINGILRFLTATADFTGRLLRLFHSGLAQTYAFFIVAGLFLLLYFILR